MTLEPTVDSLFDLRGKVALITGGTGYLGSAMSRALAEVGAQVVITSRELVRAEEAAVLLPGEQPHFGVELDHKSEESITTGFAKAVELAGHVDILVNNGQGGNAKD
ncbi:MAG: SDR family NAD(P)-dependent oxidoreductase, partial [Planctomycetota bacterium]|nr:SDR family NAD(P)-dependent oxidoreductase [Planctomycetota bacterium]